MSVGLTTQRRVASSSALGLVDVAAAWLVETAYSPYSGKASRVRRVLAGSQAVEADALENTQASRIGDERTHGMEDRPSAEAGRTSVSVGWEAVAAMVAVANTAAETAAGPANPVGSQDSWNSL
jgi:hypothetical protein